MAADVPSIALFANGDRGLAVGRALVDAGITPSCFIWHGSRVADPYSLAGFPSSVLCLHMSGRSDVDWEGVSSLLRSVRPDVGLVAGFSYLVPSRVLQIPANGFLNLHAGAVPAYRGGSPLNWQIANGESFAGLSVLRMTAGIDDGPVVDSELVPIYATTTIADLHSRANNVFSSLVVRVASDLDRALAGAVPQDPQNARYWHQRSDVDGRFDPRLIETDHLERLVRAVTRPYSGAWAMVGDQDLRLFEVRRSERAFCGTPGRIVILPNDRPILVLRDGSLDVHDYRLGTSSDGLRNGMHVT